MIKIASMVGAPDLQAPTLAPYSGDLGQAFSKLAALGFEGVELMTKNPCLLDGETIRLLLAEHNLELTGLCSGHVFGEDKLGLVQPDLTINREAVIRLKDFIDFAASYFKPGTMVNLGRSRGVGDPQRMDETLQVACTAFRELAEFASPRRVRLILEPITRREVNFIHSTLDGYRMVQMVDHPNFGLMPDTYHMYLEDEDLIQSLYLAAPAIWHIHFSDSNRSWPGSAQIDYLHIISVLNEIGYEGFVSIEIKPWPDPDSSARLSMDFLRRYIPLPA